MPDTDLSLISLNLITTRKHYHPILQGGNKGSVKPHNLSEITQPVSGAKLKCSSLSCVQLFVTPWTVAPRFLSPWNSLGKNTGVGSHSLLQGIFSTQGSNPGLLHCRQILYHLSHQGSPVSGIARVWTHSSFTMLLLVLKKEGREVNAFFFSMPKGLNRLRVAIPASSTLIRQTSSYLNDFCLSRLHTHTHTHVYLMQHNTLVIFIFWVIALLFPIMGFNMGDKDDEKQFQKDTGESFAHHWVNKGELS